MNLSPADRPADVYSEVASLVESARQKDAESGVLIAQQLDGERDILPSKHFNIFLCAL